MSKVSNIIGIISSIIIILIISLIYFFIGEYAFHPLLILLAIIGFIYLIFSIIKLRKDN
ncbi:MAG: hypothetical protein Q7S27_04120 [Nanoarchaeota archaeon]|nr:hypothetical protein [Nanoarchaeota archaeon]